MEQQQQQQQVVPGGESKTTVLSAKIQKPNVRYISLEDRDSSAVVIGELSYCKLSRVAATLRIVIKPLEEEQAIETVINTDTDSEAMNALILLTQAIKEYMIGARDVLEIASKIVSDRKSESISKDSKEESCNENPQ